MEKSGNTTTFNTGTSTPIPGLHGHHIPHIHRARLRQFLHPSGRRIHVALSPEEADRLKQSMTNEKTRQDTLASLAQIEHGWGAEIDDNNNFDLVIHGSPEHVEALRETHEHHAAKWDDLKTNHADLAAQFEDIYHHMDSLNDELHNISEHAVQLDANFSKYGYSAHIRTRDSPNQSKATSLYGDSSEHHDWLADRDRGVPMRFYQTPIIRQYFHKNLLWRATENQEVASYELFVDLLYVGIIAIAGDSATENANGETFLKFAVTFVMGWKFWIEVTNFIGWFDADDIVRRFLVLFDLVLLLGFTTNIVECFDMTYTPMVAFYLGGRIYAALYFLWMAYAIPMVRGTLLGNAFVIVIPVCLWIASIHVPMFSNQGLIWVALLFDLYGHVWLIVVGRKVMTRTAKDSRVVAWIDRQFEFTPAANIEHRIERTGAFVTLVFGYSVVALLFQSRVPFGLNSFFGKAVLGLIQAFSFNWLYFEVDSFNLFTHAIRRSVASSMVWFSIHLPFIMSFVLSGAALSRLVLARDCVNSPVEALAEAYVARSEPEISMALRWFYCVGLGIALASMGVISMSHEYKKIPSMRVKRAHRLVLRFVVALVFILLPLAGDRLSSLGMVGTTCGLTLLVLVFDLFGSTCIHEAFFRCNRKRCGYMTKCQISKKELQANLAEGKVLNVEELASRGTEKGIIQYT